MAELSVEQALLRASAHTRKGEVAQAKALYDAVLVAYPKNMRAQKGLANLHAPMHEKQDIKTPSKQQLDALIASYNTGRFSELIGQAEQLISEYPSSFLLWNILAVGRKALGQLAEAEQGFRRATELNPSYAGAYSNMGVTLQEQGKLDQAITAYHRALEINPANAEAYNNMGNALQEQGKLDEAITAYHRALEIKPANAEAHNNLGNALQEQGKLAEAITAYHRALEINPAYAEAHYNMGNALQEQGKLEEAITAYHRALEINPAYAEAHNNLGNALKEQGKLAEAITAYHRALEINPANAEAYNNMGNALQEQGKLEEAVSAFHRALEINPAYAEAHNNIGNALKDQGKLAEAITAYHRALEINPAYAEAYNNMGNTLKAQGKLDEAITAYHRALEINPVYAEAYWNKSLALLLIGDFAAGWPLYEYRWKRKKSKPQRHASKPTWLGSESLRDKTILLHAEQGLGDTIQFCRYAELVAECGATVILEVQRPLRALLENLDGVSTLVMQGDELPDFDSQCSLLSLPLAFKTMERTIPRADAYLSADAEKIQRWGARLGVRTRMRVGIVWSGATGHTNDRNRSMTLAQWMPMLNADYDWVSLQKEVRECDQETLKNASQIRHFGDELKDYSDTAAMCALCDIVLSVDTSVAHLAGALGKPVWILLPFSPDWRWMLDRDDSPWYRTMRLFRQQPHGDWDGVIVRIKDSLGLLV